MRASFPRGYWLVLGLLAGCSALIDADKSKLGELGGASGGQGNSGQGDGGGEVCPAGCPSDQRCNPARGCVPIACGTDVDCNDGNLCNGIETCAPGSAGADAQTGCRTSAVPDCDDDVGCTLDSCDPTQGCVNKPNDTLCDDGVHCTLDACSADATAGADGCTHTPDHSRCSFCNDDGYCSVKDRGCMGSIPTNCRDGNLCTVDRCDDVSQSCVNTPRDDDGDGFAPGACGGQDCDDDDPSAYPGAKEVCDGKDDNCNRRIDEGCQKLPDTCASAETVELSNGQATITGILGNFSSDYGSPCGESAGRDAVYAIPVDRTSDIVFDSLGSDARIVLAVSEDCDLGWSGLACTGSIVTNGDRTRLMLHRYTPPPDKGNLLYLLVDGANSSAVGAFSINISVTRAKEDACKDVFDLGACGTVLGFISTSTGTQRGSCQPGGRPATQPEAIMQVKAPLDETLEVVALSRDFTPALYARAGCNKQRAAFEHGCAVGQSGRAELAFKATAGSNVFIMLDGASMGASYLLKCVP